MKIVACQAERHADAILAIFNEAIVNTTALYDYKPRTRAVIDAWFEAKVNNNYPIIGAEDGAGELMGFATYGSFRAFPAYKYTVEHSVYVDTRFRRQGVGRRLLTEIISGAEAQQFHCMIGVIDSANQASIKLHEELGFTRCGAIAQAGFKFGRWLDLVFYQRILAGPEKPVDG